MTTKVGEYPGGTVTKVGKRSWAVNAPDGRPVGKYPIRKQAIEKAQHWDKWDAFASLGDICVAIAPFSTLLVLDTLLSIGSEKGFKIHSEEDIQKAMLMDGVLMFLLRLEVEEKIDDKKVVEIMTKVAEVLYPKGEVAS